MLPHESIYLDYDFLQLNLMKKYDTQTTSLNEMGSFTDLLKVYWSKSEWTVSNDFSIQDELDVPTGKLLALHNKKETKCCCSYPRDRFWQEWHCHDVYLHSLLQSRILNLDVTKIGMKARYDFNRFSTNSSKFTCVHGRICIDLLSMQIC